MSTVGYLSGSLRVSTDAGAEMGGPRSHVLGMIAAFEGAGLDVERYIAGDQPWARRLGGNGREAEVRQAKWRALAADALRLGAGRWNAVAARRSLGRPAFVYERFASMQSLGAGFQRRGVPWVVETSGPFFHEAKVERGTLALDSIARRIELGTYRRCDLLVCVSEPLRDFLVAEGVPAARTFVLPNGVDVRRFDPAAVTTAPHDGVVVGFVGTVQSWQGLDLLVDAVAAVRAEGLDVRAEIVGDGSGLAAVRERVAAHALEDSVHLVGQVPGSDVPSRIAGFDFGFAGHVPLLEGRMYHSPLKLYEYMAMGKPVIASAFDDARRLVEGSGHGLLFEPGSTADLTATLRRAVADVDAARASAGEISAHIRDHESWDRRVADLLAELRTRGLIR